MTAARRPPIYFTVPAGARPTNCRGCQALIYFVKSQADKWVPVDCHGDDHCVPPSALADGTGVSHFGNCPKADSFRRPRA